MLDFNIAEHVTKKLMLENNIMMMRMQMKRSGEVLRSPQLQEMEETHVQITGNLMLLVEEKDLRMKDIDKARREEAERITRQHRPDLFERQKGDPPY